MYKLQFWLEERHSQSEEVSASAQLGAPITCTMGYLPPLSLHKWRGLKYLLSHFNDKLSRFQLITYTMGYHRRSPRFTNEQALDNCLSQLPAFTCWWKTLSVYLWHFQIWLKAFHLLLLTSLWRAAWGEQFIGPMPCSPKTTFHPHPHSQRQKQQTLVVLVIFVWLKSLRKAVHWPQSLGRCTKQPLESTKALRS